MDERDAAESGRILVIEDERDVVELLTYNLGKAGYAVSAAVNGEAGLALARAQRPDLVLLDLMLPGIDGFTVCRRLREDFRTLHTPILMLTARGETRDRVQGLRVGADDYLPKPFSLVELLARVRALLRRAESGLDANPLTRLPGNRAIQDRLETLIAAGRPFAALYADIDRFKTFNDRFGTLVGDRLIRLTADLLADAVGGSESELRFVGHVGGDDFVVFCDPAWVDRVGHAVVSAFDAQAPSLAPPVGEDTGIRLGEGGGAGGPAVPTLTVVGVVNEGRRFVTPEQVSVSLAVLKRLAKGRPGGSLVTVDRVA
jgi:PleD family two-component response regulator